jgi:hypothetical protein
MRIARVALTVILVGQLLMIVVLRSRRGHSHPPAAPAPAASGEPPSASASRERAGPAPARAMVPRAGPGRPATAHLRGRVVLPAGQDPAGGLDDLEVKASDGTHELDGLVSEGGRFSFHLPPGRYTLVARTEDLVGSRSDVPALAGETRDETIRLAPAAELSGRIAGAGDRSVTVKATRTGSSTVEASVNSDSDNSFALQKIEAGQSYDLELSAGGLRTTVVRGVIAPATSLDLKVTALPVLRGAIGFARGEGCPIEKVQWSHEADDDEAVDLGSDCRFELPVPADVPRATLLATGPGWRLEEEIAIPTDGDPDPVCLNPPCRDDPPEPLASLTVTVTDLPADQDTIVTAVGDGSLQTCAPTASAPCRMDDLLPHASLDVQVGGTYCSGGRRRVVPMPGENSITIACIHRRSVEGVLHTGGQPPPAWMAIRCAGQRTLEILKGTWTFSLSCPMSIAALEYQVDEDGPWTSVAIPAGADPALVEIATR